MGDSEIIVRGQIHSATNCGHFRGKHFNETSPNNFVKGTLGNWCVASMQQQALVPRPQPSLPLPPADIPSYKCHPCTCVLSLPACVRNRSLRNNITIHLCEVSQAKCCLAHEWHCHPCCPCLIIMHAQLVRESGCVTLHCSHWQSQKALEAACFHSKLYFDFHRLFEQK